VIKLKHRCACAVFDKRLASVQQEFGNRSASAIIACEQGLGVQQHDGDVGRRVPARRCQKLFPARLLNGR
jgi:hypothetical protein